MPKLQVDGETVAEIDQATADRLLNAAKVGIGQERQHPGSPNALMPKRKGAWARDDRVVLGPATAKRAGKLGLIGENLALAELAASGFTAIRHLNVLKRNHPFADIYAERNGEKFWISVKTRNKYQIDKTINPSYKISPKQRISAVLLEKSPGTIAACIGISVVVSEKSSLAGEPPNSYSCYFARLGALTRRHGMGMRLRDLQNYDCLAENKPVPTDYDISDCENVFQRRHTRS